MFKDANMALHKHPLKKTKCASGKKGKNVVTPKYNTFSAQGKKKVKKRLAKQLQKDGYSLENLT